jgi:hypothetical protein
LELKEQSLPNAADWTAALTRSASLFGLTLGQTLNAANVGKLVDDVRRTAAGKRDAIARLVSQLRDRSSRYAPDIAGARQQTAESAQALLAALAQATDADVVATLAGAALQTSDAAVGRSLAQAQPCADALGSGPWQLFDVMRNLSDHRRDAAQAIMSRLSEALTSDEHVVSLKPRLDELAGNAMRLLVEAVPSPQPAPPPQVPTPPLPTVPIPPVSPVAESAVVAEKQQVILNAAAAVTALDALKTLVTSEDDLELTISWRLQRKGTRP